MERTREVDDTVVLPEDAEVMGDEADDEFADLFGGAVAPRIMITTAPSPSGKIYRLIAEFMAILPNSFFYKRKHFPLKKICTWATEMGFTHLLVLGEKAKKANSLHVVNLPYGPTAAFRLSSSMLSSEIKNHGTMTSHVPEVILTNFVTRLGRRVGRFIGSLYPRVRACVRAGGGVGGQVVVVFGVWCVAAVAVWCLVACAPRQPPPHPPAQKADYSGRRVCTFHNQRDFVFFRQHRYVFKDDGSGVRLQELGPRFTLKLKWILAGTFDTKFGEYEWYHKRHEMETSRRRFML